MDSNTRVTIPTGTDAETANTMILSVASKTAPVKVLVVYEDQGSDLLLVQPDGSLEVIDDGS